VCLYVPFGTRSVVHRLETYFINNRLYLLIRLKMLFTEVEYFFVLSSSLISLSVSLRNRGYGIETLRLAVLLCHFNETRRLNYTWIYSVSPEDGGSIFHRNIIFTYKSTRRYNPQDRH
jgi:hypothetical protein